MASPSLAAAAVPAPPPPPPTSAPANAAEPPSSSSDDRPRPPLHLPPPGNRRPASTAARALGSTALRHLRAACRAVTLSECSGALGDLGTFLPLTLGLVQSVGLDFGTTLLFTGVYNVYSGILTRAPMCVQPMKTIAAVAIAAGGAIPLVQVMAAGIFVSSAVLVLGATRLVDALNRIVPRSVVRGLQMGVGLKLAGSGLRMALTLKPLPRAAGAAAAAAALRWRPALGSDGLLLGVFGLAFLLVTTIARRGPDEPADVERPLSLPSAWPPRKWRRRRLLPGGGGDREASPASSSSAGGGGATGSVSAALLLAPSPSPAGDGPPRAPPSGAPSSSLQGEAEEIEAAAAPAARAMEQHPQPPPQPQHPQLQPPQKQLRIPSALLVVLLGVALTLATAPAGSLWPEQSFRLGPSRPALTVPSPQDMLAGVTTAGGLAQLPLTTLNSVLAVTQLADALYGAERPQDRWRWRPSMLAASVGAMNLVGCFFGAMPSCHGSGGLAAQHLYGARTGTAPVLLGVLKIVLALLLGSSLFGLLRVFPEPLLGAMLALSGVELASAARRERGPRGFTLLALTAAAILALDDAALGFAVGYGGWLTVVACEFLGARARAWRARQRRASRESEVAAAAQKGKAGAAADAAAAEA